MAYSEGGTPQGVRFVVLGYDIGYEDGAGEYIHYFFVIPVALTNASLCDA